MAIAVLAVGLLASASRADDDVTFALNWLPVGEAAGWYTALEKGYFREEKLNVGIVRGLGSDSSSARFALPRDWSAP